MAVNKNQSQIVYTVMAAEQRSSPPFGVTYHSSWNKRGKATRFHQRFLTYLLHVIALQSFICPPAIIISLSPLANVTWGDNNTQTLHFLNGSGRSIMGEITPYTLYLRYRLSPALADRIKAHK